MPDSNPALYERNVSLTRDQVLLEGEVASQQGTPFFSNNPTGAQAIGGGRQTVTDNGHRTNAIETVTESSPNPGFNPTTGLEDIFKFENYFPPTPLIRND